MYYLNKFPMTNSMQMRVPRTLFCLFSVLLILDALSLMVNHVPKLRAYQKFLSVFCCHGKLIYESSLVGLNIKR